MRVLWGAFDWQEGSDNPYADAETKSGGAAADPGTGHIGVRRATLFFDRSSYSPADDDMTVHFDFLNMTSGEPDDTWITSDFTGLETLLTTWWGQAKGQSDPKTKLREIRWHRVGPGNDPPNPAVRIYVLPSMVAGSGTAGASVAQVACSVTFRTAVRTSWGRTYIPFNGVAPDAQGRWSTTLVDLVATYTNALLVSAAAADMHLVVTSLAKSAALNVERIEADDVPDIVRRRRLKHTVYRKLLP